MSDVLGALQSQLGSLKAGMHRIQLPDQSYQHASKPLADTMLLNLYAESEPSNARSPAALISTPGLVLSLTFGTGPILAMNADLPGVLYVASGTEFYRQRIDLMGVHLDDLGPIGSPATGVVPTQDLMVTIAVGPTACVVVVPPNAFTCTHLGAMNQISGGFPGATSVAYLDGYFVFTNYADNAQFFISALLDPTMYSALDFAFSDGLTNVIHRVLTHRGEIWLCGDTGISVWYDTGIANSVGGILLDFPFLPRAGANIPNGVATPQCLAQGDSSVFWVGYDGIVYRSKGYNAERISTHALEVILQGQDVRQIVSGLMHTQGGHVFYCFTLGAVTYCYDISTQKWHNRSSSIDGSLRWIPSVSSLIGQQLFGDSVNGNLYATDANFSTENGITVLRQMTMPPIWAGTNRAFMNRLEIEMETGGATPGSTLLLEWSDDGGWTWTGSRALDAGAAGARTKRVVTTRLGSFHQRVFRLSCQGHATFYAIDADITSPQAGG
jgi:hypothetical protein